MENGLMVWLTGPAAPLAYDGMAIVRRFPFDSRLGGLCIHTLAGVLGAHISRARLNRPRKMNRARLVRLVGADPCEQIFHVLAD